MLRLVVARENERDFWIAWNFLHEANHKKQYLMSGNESFVKYYTQENIILATTVEDILNNSAYSTIRT